MKGRPRVLVDFNNRLTGMGGFLVAGPEHGLPVGTEVELFDEVEGIWTVGWVDREAGAYRAQLPLRFRDA